MPAPVPLTRSSGNHLALIRGLPARHIQASDGTAIDTRFPLGTFVINVSGSFLLGVLGAIVAGRFLPASDALRLALGVGFRDGPDVVLVRADAH